MFSKTCQQIAQLSRTTLLAATGLVLLAGCGGGGNNNGGTTTTVPAGSYQGVYVNTSGQFSPDAGTIAFTVNSDGTVSGSSVDYTGDGSTNAFSGTVSGTGALVTNAIAGNITQKSTTHVFSASYTETNGTKGTLNVGIVPAASPLAGTFTGTAKGSDNSLTPVTFTITAAGVVTGTVGDTTVAGQSFTVSGYVDSNNNSYLAGTSSGGPEKFIGQLTLSGTALTGSVTSNASDGSTSTATLSLTKQ